MTKAKKMVATLAALIVVGTSGLVAGYGTPAHAAGYQFCFQNTMCMYRDSDGQVLIYAATWKPVAWCNNLPTAVNDQMTSVRNRFVQPRLKVRIFANRDCTGSWRDVSPTLTASFNGWSGFNDTASSWRTYNA